MSYNCSRLTASGTSCFGQLTSSGGCEPCDTEIENENAILSNNRGQFISKTRGVPSMGSTNYGPRGQRQSFLGFGGGNERSTNVGQLVLGYLAIGLTAFVVGYSLMKGKERAN